MEHSQLLEKPTVSKPKSIRYADSIEESIAFTAEGDQSQKTDISSTKADDDYDELVTDMEYSINTSALITEEQDVNDVKAKLDKSEEQCKMLKTENEQVISQLETERIKTAKLEKKLQFVKDNQEVFIRLKEAYINMKYNEASGRKMIEIREKGIQTWQGILCKACLETEEVRRQVAILTKKYHEFFVASPGEMEQLINTVKYMKDLIERREQSWAINLERENKLQYHIHTLERENTTLREVLQNRDENLDDPLLKQGEKIDQILDRDKKIEEAQKCVETLTRDVDKMKKIIAKYEKSFREYERNNSLIIVHPLNEKEKKHVNQIIAGFNAKMGKNEKARSRSHSVERSIPTRRPTSPFRNSRSSTPTNPHRPESSAIMLIDSLLDKDFI